MSDLFSSAGLETEAPRPLADRLRPQTLDDVVGQDHVLGPEGPLGRMLAQGRLSSLILWGPPGVGKTTIARLLAEKAGLEFDAISAVFSTPIFSMSDMVMMLVSRSRATFTASRGTCQPPMPT